MFHSIAILLAFVAMAIALFGWIRRGTKEMRELNADRRATLERFREQPIELVVDHARVFVAKPGRIRDITEKGVVFDDGTRERFYPLNAVMGLNTASGAPLANWANPDRRLRVGDDD